MSLLPLVAVTGFLGKSADFASLKTFHPLELSAPNQGFYAYASELSRRVPQGSALLGYSLGGRLALHTLLANPTHYSAAIIVSAHPGLTTKQEREIRLQSDAVWAEAFLKEPWDDLMQKWESQEVFRSSRFILKRAEADFDRRALADCLFHYSLGKQEDLRSQLACLNMPILWMVGEKDEKFRAVSQPLKFSHPDSKVLIVADAGHRIPWEQAEQFQKAVYSFLSRS